jgi:Fe-S cluster assembly scaffold protein SufB
MKKQIEKITKAGTYVFELDKPGTDLEVSMALEAAGEEILEIDLLIHHRVANTTANTILKAVGTDKSQIIIKAKILIDKDCPNTESFLTEKVLLISSEAKAIAVPDLEILSDDVKCSHAASVSKIPEKQIFYLMSRGVSRKKAQEMIVEGFLQGQTL